MTLKFTLGHRVGDFYLDASAEASGVVGVFGPSGAGKTTLLHLLAGLTRPDEGMVEVGGEVWVDTLKGRWTPPHRRGAGVVFQSARLFPHLTVRENLSFGAPGGRRDGPDLEEVARLLEIEGLLERKPADLSGGEEKRVALGRALLAEPSLLLLDEPLTGLDEPRRRRLLPFLRKARDAVGCPLLYVSHDLAEIRYLTDRLIVMDGGRVVAAGEFSDLVADPRTLPLIHGMGLVNVLRCRVAAHRVDEGLTHLEAETAAGPGPTLRAPLLEAPLGSRVTLSLRPADVALATGAVAGTSVQNSWEGRVRSLTGAEGHVLAVVDAGVPLLVEISRHALKDLGLKEGTGVRAMFKAHAVSVLD